MTHRDTTIAAVALALGAALGFAAHAAWHHGGTIEGARGAAEPPNLGGVGSSPTPSGALRRPLLGHGRGEVVTVIVDGFEVAEVDPYTGSELLYGSWVDLSSIHRETFEALACMCCEVVW